MKCYVPNLDNQEIGLTKGGASITQILIKEKKYPDAQKYLLVRVAPS